MATPVATPDPPPSKLCSPQPDTDMVRVVFVPIAVPGVHEWPDGEAGTAAAADGEALPEDVRRPFVIQIHVQQGVCV